MLLWNVNLLKGDVLILLCVERQDVDAILHVFLLNINVRRMINTRIYLEVNGRFLSCKWQSIKILFVSLWWNIHLL